ncbi:hypothetical protein B0I08_10586 [Glaciihabitans tibetensis]|uniref:Uncharacterized protein n=1 Tax=Glaciihabitans tibetensis TaxID=1266600 RepID=A0A2T0VCV3_9MICO|nr:hypothetical protein [Glaciihabitans tibetensis]PRY67925.1 hypothetical protein B0I08_10586 [Glaciihabitans tibetensis]
MANRATISLQTFDDVASESFQDWLAARRRVLSKVSVSRSALASLKTTLDFGESLSAWIVVAANGRSVASSAALYPDPEAARQSARDALARVTDLELLHVQAATPPAYAWLLQLDGIPLVMPLRHYPTARLRNASAATVIDKLGSAKVDSPAPQVEAEVAPARLAENVASAGKKIDAGPLLASPLILGGPLRPIKTRGAQRPIRPISRRQEHHHVRSRQAPPDTRV